MGAPMGDMQQQAQVVQVVKETSKWWIPIVVAGIAAIAGIIKAVLNRRKKENSNV